MDVEILLHVVISVVASCLCVFALMRARGVRGVRALHRDLLDLQADHDALAKRLKRMQNSAAGEASAESKAKMGKATVDFLAAHPDPGVSGQVAIGQ